MTPRVRFARHALQRLARYGVRRDEVLGIIESADDVTIGATAVEYDAHVGDRLIHVVVVRGSDPPLVITLYPRNR